MLIVQNRKHGINFYTVWFAKEPLLKKGIVSYREYMGEKPDTDCTVPGLIGKTPAEANVAATNAGLFLRFTGTTASTSGSIRVLRQSEDVGTKLPAGWASAVTPTM